MLPSSVDTTTPPMALSPMIPTRSKQDSLRHATRDDVPQLARVLARAFEHDPLIEWLVPRDERLHARAAGLFAGYLQLLALPHGMTWTTPDQQGAALWSPPGKWKMGLLTQLRIAPRIIAATGLARLPTRVVGLETILAAHPGTPHYYLQVLGIDPDAQGMGWGSQLIRRGTDIADRDGMPCYLETMTERNVALYLRHGFRVVGEMRLPFAGPPVWRMWREPVEPSPSPA